MLPQVGFTLKLIPTLGCLVQSQKVCYLLKTVFLLQTWLKADITLIVIAWAGLADSPSSQNLKQPPCIRWCHNSSPT